LSSSVYFIFAENVRRRGIEGWAVVPFDVAQWGQTNNVRIVAAEPASGFGEAARAIVQQSARRPAPYGYTGCLEQVRFVMPPPDAPAP
jgi:TonB family protein